MILIHVYDDDDNIVKECIAQETSIKFGAVRSIMKLLKVNDQDSAFDVISTVSDVWDQLTAILNRCFPEMEEEDWDNVKLEELVPAVLKIVSGAFGKMQEIPAEKN